MKLRGKIEQGEDGFYIVHKNGARGGPFISAAGARKVQIAAAAAAEASRQYSASAPAEVERLVQALREAVPVKPLTAPGLEGVSLGLAYIQRATKRAVEAAGRGDQAAVLAELHAIADNTRFIEEELTR